MHISHDDIVELEFPELLAQIAPLAYSPQTAERILHLRPLDKAGAIDSLTKTTEYLTSIESNNIIPFHEFPDLSAELQVLPIQNYRLDAEGFIKIKSVTQQVGRLKKFFPLFEPAFPSLLAQIEQVEFHKEIVTLIDDVFNRFGEIKNDASVDLRSIRQEISNASKAIQQNFSRALSQYSQGDLLDDIRETIIEDQRVLAVKSGFKKRVPGRILGVSKTGSITYIQPESVLKHYFRLRESKEEEKKETDRILRNLTAEMATYHGNLILYQSYLLQLDLIRAKALFAHRIGGVLPKINNHRTLRLKNAYHPLLYLSNLHEKKTVFPQSLTLTAENRILCISGPNAGGKSITLKTVGLLQLMIQSGILVPVHPKSEMFFFEKIMTDIGDNQSIENHLSTYSSRLKKMSGIIREADADTLLLIDEFGTGSDPELGGALAESFLEYFYRKNAFAIITTHYSNIKILIEQLPHAQNAAMLFDEHSLEPLYKLEVGQAGSSFTFEVAEKNKIPAPIIHSARKKVERDVVNLDKTIVKLQQEKFEVEKLKQNLEETKLSQSEKRNNLQRLNEQLEQKLYNFQKLYEEEHRKLQFGNKIETFIRDYIEGKSRKDVVKEFVKLLEQEKYKKTDIDKDRSKQLQIVKRKITQQLKKSDVQEKIQQTNKQLETAKASERSLWIKPGQRVRIEGSTSVGTIEKVERNKVVINYGTFKTTIGSDKIERI